MLIVIEGPDGAGKTTIMEYLKKHIVQPNVHFTNPFDNDYGRSVKSVLNYSDISFPTVSQNEQIFKFTHKFELMKNVLYNAHELWKEKILSPDHLVFMDRWIPSFYTYQQPYFMEETSKFFSQYFDYHEGSCIRPHMTFYLMPSEDVLIERIHARKVKDNLDDYFLSKIHQIVQDYCRYILLYESETSHKIIDTAMENSTDQVLTLFKTWLFERGCVHV